MIAVRRYGQAPFRVVVIHGGPGAAGEMAPVARQLSKKFGVLEPLQTKESVTEQLDELTLQLSEFEGPFIVVGYSWGAWLALLFAKAHPESVRRLVLVGCPPFTQKEAQGIMQARLMRLGARDKQRVLALMEKEKLSDEELTQVGALMDKADTVEPINNAPEPVKVDAKIAEAVWSEAKAMRERGEWEQILRQVKAPITMIHGRQDPHPYSAVQRALEDSDVAFDMSVINECGHTPWKEAKKLSAFYKLLLIYLSEK